MPSWRRQPFEPSPEDTGPIPSDSADWTFDVGALLRCRKEAEQAVQQSRTPLHRSRGGFAFSTEQGALKSRAAGRVLLEIDIRSRPRPS